MKASLTLVVVSILAFAACISLTVASPTPWNVGFTTMAGEYTMLNVGLYLKHN